MPKFNESKVINELHIDKAEVGKKYWFDDHLGNLKTKVEKEEKSLELKSINHEDSLYPFIMGNNFSYELLYPYEEPPKQRMTNLMFIEWVAKGNGMYSRRASPTMNISIICRRDSLNEEVDEDIVIRPWDSEEWIEPTVDIYERDCKKEIEK